MTTEEIDACINFNKNSWHYRLVIFVFGRYWQYDYNNAGKFDTSLCTYMRHVVGAMFIFPFKGIWHILPYRVPSKTRPIPPKNTANPKYQVESKPNFEGRTK